MASYAQEAGPFTIAQLLVRVYYFFLLYTSIDLFTTWDLSIAPKTEISFILPIEWIGIVGFPTGFILVRLFFIAASLLAVLTPQWRLSRILSFIALLEFVSLLFSILKLDVDWYTMLLTSFVLIFLPGKWENVAAFPAPARQKFLLVFWGCQAVVLLTYSMSGIGKIYGALT